MTNQKAFKNRVRARMAETGESYTLARKQLLDRNGPQPVPSGDGDPGEPGATGLGADGLPDGTSAGPDAAAQTRRAQGGANRSIVSATGHDQDEWYALLDAWGATGRTHTQIARWLVTEHEVRGWWSQTIAVSYEQARGMRAPGQDGNDGGAAFTVTVSRTIDVPIEDTYNAFIDEWTRSEWLPDVRIRVRTATAPTSFLADFGTDQGRLSVTLLAKTPERTTVALTHEKLPDSEETARRKAFWQEHLSLLKDLLEEDSG